jgi:cellulose synthase/poly-beta-1,6-N-acetylglucosamine synthase-like glycosyltransferase
VIKVNLVLLILSILPPFYLYISSLKTPNLEPNSHEKIIPPITILLPVRNEIKNIERKINELVLLFNDKDAKLIIIDSNSQDNTAGKAKEVLLNADVKFDWKVISSKIMGKSKAINSIIDLIDTPWFVMFDADASVNIDSINHLTAWMTDPSCGAVCGSQMLDNDNFHYRKRFNSIRKAESFHDSATVFEGSLCAVRLEALEGRKLFDHINADDTQFALIVKRNGYRAIFEPRAVFIDQEPVNFRYSFKRNIRRSQGLIRVLWKNKDLASIKSSFGRYYLNSFYFYILFPWFFTISSLLLAHKTFVLINSFHNLALNLLILVLFLIILKLKPISSFLNGLASLVTAQVSYILGKRFNSWSPDRE